jgi:penicillin amidase
MTLPGQWYVTHMECPEFTAAGPCNPGYPGPLFYGHNTHVAWTMTHAQGDRWDIYRERVRQGANGPEYLFEGDWYPFERREETYAVRDGADEVRTLWLTRHGPVLSGNPETDEEVLAARWGLEEPAHDIDSVLAVLHARSAAEARAGFRQYESVSGNFCFADTAGDIGYQYAGRIPKRPAWFVPVPGWTGDHEWDGYIPVDELPAEDNPAAGYVMTANNRTTTPDYPHYLTYMASRFRADRLRELIDATPQFAPGDMRRLQSDVTSVGARGLAAIFAGVTVSDADAQRLQQLFRGWDAALTPESAAALAYDAVCDALTARTLRACYDRVPGGVTFTHYELRRMLIDEVTSRSPATLVDVASWDDAIAAALTESAGTLHERYGADPAAWRWDARHQARWRHNLGRDRQFASLNLEPIGAGGDGTTPFATTSDFDGSVIAGVSYRQVFDLSDLNAAQICIPPGNSGQPGSPHYSDNTDRWRDVEYHPLYIDWGDIAANSEATLTLRPSMA